MLTPLRSSGQVEEQVEKRNQRLLHILELIVQRACAQAATVVTAAATRCSLTAQAGST